MRKISLPGQRATLGFLLASLHTGASRALWPGLLDVAERQDVNLICFPGGRLKTSVAYEGQRNLIYDLAGEACLDGLVTWSSSLGDVVGPAGIQSFHRRYQELPMVSLAQFMEGMPTVSVDSYHGMRALLDHLIDVHGYHRLAFIRGPEEHYYAQERYRAYLDTLQSHNLPFIPELVTRPLRWEAGIEAINLLLDERSLQPGVDFQAIVAVSDMLAVWALKALQARGIKIPADVAVTGFNNSIEERLATPPLTTVDLPFYNQGAKALEVLLAQLSGEPVPALITLPSNLIVRQSCGCSSAGVAHAAFTPPFAPPDLPAEALKDLPWSECLAEMEGYLGVVDDAAHGWLKSVLEAAQSDLLQSASHQLLAVLENVLDQSGRAGHAIPPWQDVISVLRKHILPLLSIHQRTNAEAIFSQARVVVSEGAQRAQAYWQWQEERQAEKLREINHALLTSFEFQQLTDVLVEHLPGLGIPSAYLALYDQSPGTPEYAHLILAYTEQGRAALEPGGMHFATRQLIPPGFLPHHRRYSLVVEPLYFQEKSIGYAVFEIGPHHSDIYELLRSNLSSALQGAMLFQEIKQARITAEKADRVKTRLLANVSHELRTPLNIIIGYTQNILQAQEATHALEPDLESDIQHIHSHAEHQLRVINDLLDLSRAEIDELDLALELIDPLPLLVEAFHSIADHAANPGLIWRTELPERLPLLRADPVRLRQVLFNLLNNAGKFTERGQVVLGGEVAPPNLHLWVCDTGWGISTEQQERIFEPFITIEQAHDRQITGGIGLGLSITRHIVALHGGKLVLDSEPGKGSTFHIYLPLPALEHDLSSTENTHPVLLVLSASGAPAAEIAEIASRQKLEIITIRQVEDIEAILAKTQPLAVAWDLSSAQAGDWSLVRRLYHHPAIHQTPFIVYGQQSESESGKPVLNVGMTSFVVKSPQQKTLLDTMNALCPAQPTGSILIVDDDPQVRENHQTLIRAGFPGCSIRLAENGESALEQMAKEVPALVLLDLMMPGLSGADVLDQMRSDMRLRQVPVIILSNKFLSLDDIKRLEYHTRVKLQNKDIWTESESLEAIHRALTDDGILPTHTSALVKRVLVYIHQNYARPLTRWEIAQSVGISEDYLTRLFNRELGLSPWDYLNRYRILKARLLLTNTSLSIGTITRQVGFKDPSYFSRVCRKVLGMSPQELLKTLKK